MSFYTQQSVELISESKVKMIKSGTRHAVALTHTNEVYTWGASNLGQLGFNISESRINIKSEFNFETGDMFSYLGVPEIVPFFHK